MKCQIGGFLKESFWTWLIVGVTVLIYGHSLSNGFIWDDRGYLPPSASTMLLKDFLSLWTFSNPLSAFPLTVSLLWLQHQLLGYHPWGYHVVSLVMHILNSLLLFWAVRRVAPTLAGAVALLFAIHPIQVETVAWIAEQKNLFCFFFLVLAFHSFLDFELSRGRREYLKTLVFFVLALLCKCIAVCFAVALLLYVWWRQGSISAKDLRRAAPFFFVGALSVIRPMLNESLGASQELSNLLFEEKVILAGKNFFFYIKQILLPWKFLTAYPAWDLRVSYGWNWLFPVTVILLFIVLFVFRRQLGRGAFALCFFYGASIFPALGFFKVSLLSMTPASDHFSYLSVPPILILGCGAVQRVWPRIGLLCGQDAWSPTPFLKNSFAILGIVYLSILSFCLTFSYKDPHTLWGRLFLERPESFEANHFLGCVCLEKQGWCDVDKAVVLLQKALSIRPDDRSTMKALGIAYERKGLFQPAIELFLRASLGRDPFIEAHYVRKVGSIYLREGDLEKAILYLEKDLALQSDPNYGKFRQWHLRMQEGLETGEALTWPLLGEAYFLSGDLQRSSRSYRQAIEQDPGKIANYDGLGEALLGLGDILGARNAFQEAYRLDPESKSAKRNLERTLKKVEGMEQEINVSPTGQIS